MSDLEQRFKEDRTMRDTARVVLMADLAHARTNLSAKGVANRIGGRIGDGAKDVLETAKVHTDDHRGIIAALIGAVILWFCREPVLEILGLSQTDGAEDEMETGMSGDDEFDDAPNDTRPNEIADDDLENDPQVDIAPTAAPIPSGDNHEQ